MKRITIAFKSEADLRRFRSIITVTEYELNFRQLTIECNCEDADIELAINTFSAKIIKTWENMLTQV